MKITSFNPLIVTKDAESVIKLFEEMGFEKRHLKDGIEGDISSVRMKDANGFHVDIAHSERMERDLSTIRMNVDDFDETYKFLEAHGLKNAQGSHTTETPSSKATLMVSPSGFSINICKHIK